MINKFIKLLLFIFVICVMFFLGCSSKTAKIHSKKNVKSDKMIHKNNVYVPNYIIFSIKNNSIEIKKVKDSIDAGEIKSIYNKNYTTDAKLVDVIQIKDKNGIINPLFALEKRGLKKLQNSLFVKKTLFGYSKNKKLINNVRNNIHIKLQKEFTRIIDKSGIISKIVALENSYLKNLNNSQKKALVESWMKNPEEAGVYKNNQRFKMEKLIKANTYASNQVYQIYLDKYMKNMDDFRKGYSLAKNCDECSIEPVENHIKSKILKEPGIVPKIVALENSPLRNLDIFQKKSIVKSWMKNPEETGIYKNNQRSKMEKLIKANTYASNQVFQIYLDKYMKDKNLKATRTPYLLALECDSCSQEKVYGYIEDLLREKSYTKLKSIAKQKNDYSSNIAFKVLLNDHFNMKRLSAFFNLHHSLKDNKNYKFTKQLNTKVTNGFKEILYSHFTLESFDKIVQLNKQIKQNSSLDFTNDIKKKIANIKNVEHKNELISIARKNNKFSASAFKAYVVNIAKSLNDIAPYRSILQNCKKCREQVLQDIALMNDFNYQFNTTSDLHNFTDSLEYKLLYSFKDIKFKYKEPTSMPVNDSTKGSFVLKAKDINNTSLSYDINYYCNLISTTTKTEKEDMKGGNLVDAVESFFGVGEKRYKICEYQYGNIRCNPTSASSDTIKNLLQNIKNSGGNVKIVQDGKFAGKTDKRLIGYKKVHWECEHGGKVVMVRVNKTTYNINGRNINVPSSASPADRSDIITSALESAVDRVCR